MSRKYHHHAWMEVGPGNVQALPLKTTPSPHPSVLLNFAPSPQPLGVQSQRGAGRGDLVKGRS